ncbi:hypothetical protein [Kutzneria sp. CA-103260]|uniref:hypothetical protein n=1 Tax=Kutzneria sp. CA-103260 TaxID=2802641 RepID=UPI001BA47261|nr:hypothetical protein [Kutzneria sp. CA-103260]QUQ72527.1 Chromosome partition protein Smc [Kutzneria sp. CA-103260]
MFRLRRLYLDSIGVADNRFSDLTVDLTDRAGNPADSIVWLRNGAGKTTMLSLLLALILPDRRDFLATRTKKRTLEDLVLGGDTAHVVAEWIDPIGQVLLTGAVYEWDGKARPRDYNGVAKDRLRRSWWCVSPDPAVDGSTLDDLPFTLRTRGQYDRERFRAHVRMLATKGVNAVVADHSIAEWHRALRERRFDPELFQYFTEVNAAEGGIDGLFSGIDSPGAFVRYLLRFVADRERVQPVRELLADTAVEIAKRPVYLVEREFCAQARSLVGKLGEAHERVLTTTTVRDTRRGITAGCKRALLDAVAAADLAHKTSSQLHKDIEASHRELRNTVDAARRRRAEYLRLAAGFRFGAAEKGLSAAKDAAARLSVEAEAWGAVADLVELATARAELKVRSAALGDAATDARPLVDAVTQAKTVLAGALDTALAEADASIEALTDELSAAQGSKTAAERERRARHEEQVRLDAEQDGLNQVIDRFTAKTNAAAADGLLVERERIDVAVIRLTTSLGTTEGSIKRLTGEQKELDTELDKATKRRKEAREANRRATDRHRQLRGELTRLERRAAEIGDSPRLRALLQTESVDLAVSADEAVVSLRTAVAAADVSMIETRAAVAEDERAVQALEATGLLPPRPGVSAVVDAFGAVGITAHPGWQYLAKHVPADQRRNRIAELPDVVDGVIVYGDAAEAVSRIDVEIDDVVAVSPASVFRDQAQAKAVLGPAAARYDVAAAGAELDRRNERLGRRRNELAELDQRRLADATLADRIGAWLADLPEDGLLGLGQRETAAAQAVAKAITAEETAETLVGELGNRRADIGERLGELRVVRVRLQGDLGRVRALDEENQQVIEPATVRLAAIPGLRRVAREREEAAEVRYRDADGAIEDIRGRLRGLKATSRNWRARRATLPDVATMTDLSVEAAESTVARSEELLRERFPEGELRRAVGESERAVAAAAASWQRHDEPIRTEAEMLAATPAGADSDLRAESAAVARSKLDEANQRIGGTEAEYRVARDELDAATPRGRVRHTDQVYEVADRAEAQRLAAEADEEATTIQIRVGQLERDRDEAESAAARARIRGRMLRDQADRLRDVEPAESTVMTLPDDEDEIRDLVARMVSEQESVDSAHSAATSARSQRADELRKWADSDRFAVVGEDEHSQAVRMLRELFRGDSVFERVAARAAELTEDLEMRGRAIGQQLKHVEEHKANVVNRLADLVDESLSVLRRASTLSELPGGIGPWEHQRFLVVEARQRPSRDQVVLRVGELVDRMVRAGKVEIEPVELLWRASEASVVEGFRATVLKPAPDQPTGRTPVEEMRKWSGGENLTASLVLFCVMARLRAEQRSGAKAGNTGGVLPLDNPLGKANYLPFLELQRRVADASGVQLVFWTGIGDLGAVTAFPRIAAMHKRLSATRPGRAYVRGDADNSFTGDQVVDVVISVRDEP